MEEKVVVTSNTTTVTKSNDNTNAVLPDKFESETELEVGVEESSIAVATTASNSAIFKTKKKRL